MKNKKTIKILALLWLWVTAWLFALMLVWGCCTTRSIKPEQKPAGCVPQSELSTRHIFILSSINDTTARAYLPGGDTVTVCW